MVVTKTFVWAHLPKAAGDMTAAIFAVFPEIIEYADPPESRGKHARFSDRADLVAGKQRVLSIRRLPEWQLSYSVHKARHGLPPTHVPMEMDSRETMITSTAADRNLSPYIQQGTAWPDRWIRAEHVVEDTIALLSEHVEVTPKKLKKIRSIRRQNEGKNYERNIKLWFTDAMIERMYGYNPLWAEAERRAYGQDS